MFIYIHKLDFEIKTLISKYYIIPSLPIIYNYM